MISIKASPFPGLGLIMPSFLFTCYRKQLSAAEWPTTKIF